MDKFTQETYAVVLQNMKQEAQNKGWLYIEVNAKELQETNEPGVKNINVVCKAMLDAMLEGDGFIVEPKAKSKIAAKLTVRYYVDNLDPSRRKFKDVL